jgi:hypothetical protein
LWFASGLWVLKGEDRASAFVHRPEVLMESLARPEARMGAPMAVKRTSSNVSNESSCSAASDGVASVLSVLAISAVALQGDVTEQVSAPALGDTPQHQPAQLAIEQGEVPVAPQGAEKQIRSESDPCIGTHRQEEEVQQQQQVLVQRQQQQQQQVQQQQEPQQQVPQQPVPQQQVPQQQVQQRHVQQQQVPQQQVTQQQQQQQQQQVQQRPQQEPQQKVTQQQVGGDEEQVPQAPECSPVEVLEQRPGHGHEQELPHRVLEPVDPKVGDVKENDGPPPHHEAQHPVQLVTEIPQAQPQLVAMPIRLYNFDCHVCKKRFTCRPFGSRWTCGRQHYFCSRECDGMSKAEFY